MDLITGPLDEYDYATFAVVVLAIVAFFYVLIQIGGLPGKLAERRKHPHAESVKMMGWIGLFTVFPWVHALIWAYHDSLTIDVRRFLGRQDGDGTAIGGNEQAANSEEPPQSSTAPAERREPVLTPATTTPGTAGEPV